MNYEYRIASRPSLFTTHSFQVRQYLPHGVRAVCFLHYSEQDPGWYALGHGTNDHIHLFFTEAGRCEDFGYLLFFAQIAIGG